MKITIDTEKKELMLHGPFKVQEFMEFMNWIPTSETYLKVQEYTIKPATEEPTQTINKWAAPIVTTPSPNKCRYPNCNNRKSSSGACCMTSCTFN